MFKLKTNSRNIKNMLKSIIGYFWSKAGTELSLDEAYSMLQTENENVINSEDVCNERSKNEFVCSQKSGTISSINGNSYVIDDTYIFDGDLKNVCVGSRVSFVVFTCNGKVKVANVTICDEWQNQQQLTGKYWCERCLIGKIVARKERQFFLTPLELMFDLTQVAIEFIPIIGDWVEIEAKVELNENVLDLTGQILEIIKVQPVRPHIIEGIVKKWDACRNVGLIDRSTYFSEISLSAGYTPLIGDKIIAEVIESDQGIYTKRAIKVAPRMVVSKNISRVEDKVKFDTENEHVLITNDLFFSVEVLGATVDFTLEIRNISEETITLGRLSLDKNSQCKIKEPLLWVNKKIQQCETVHILGTCVIKNTGITKEFIIFHFEGFTLGRSITTCVEIGQCYDNYDFKKKKKSSTIFFNNNSANIIKGPKVSLPPRFIAKRLPDYPIPHNLLNFLATCQDNDFIKKICQVKPSLSMKLQYNTYEDFFHTLLHLEELSQLEAMKIYNQESARFVRNGEFLMYEIANLAETRPSLVVGDRIIVKYNSIDGEEYEGFIHKVQANYIFLKFSSIFHADYNDEDVSIMAIASRSVYRRMHQAIAQAVINLRPEFLFPQRINLQKPQINLSIQNSGCIPKEFRWINSKLNRYQKEAVWNILLGVGRPLPYVIYGPPGTGKTITMVEAILQILILLPYSRIVVATPSNSAANLIASRLINSGILKPGDLIRLVGYQYFIQEMLPPELVPYAATIDISREGTSNHIFNTAECNAATGLNSTAIGRHRITVATCSTIGGFLTLRFPKGHFTHIFVDEAGQTTEPEVMIPISMFDVSVGQVILAGDPRQLGPIVFSKAASSLGLDLTYLDRMLDRYPYIRDVEGFKETEGYNPQFITKLVYNYRTLPTILELSSRMFYNGNLLATISDTHSEQSSFLQRLKAILPTRDDSKTPSIIFHGVLGENCRSSDSPSWFNANEASQVFYYINEFYRMGAISTDIGVISPYVKQVKLIRTLLNEAEFDLPKLGTVEEFQGHECNIILLTTVRSCEDFLRHDNYFNLGFVSNSKRLNVAITRAKALLIIVGNPHLLLKDFHWRNIIQYCIDNGVYCGCDLPT